MLIRVNGNRLNENFCSMDFGVARGQSVMFICEIFIVSNAKDLHVYSKQLQMY